MFLSFQNEHGWWDCPSACDKRQRGVDWWRDGESKCSRLLDWAVLHISDFWCSDIERTLLIMHLEYWWSFKFPPNNPLASHVSCNLWKIEKHENFEIHYVILVFHCHDLVFHLKKFLENENANRKLISISFRFPCFAKILVYSRSCAPPEHSRNLKKGCSWLWWKALSQILSGHEGVCWPKRSSRREFTNSDFSLVLILFSTLQEFFQIVIYMKFKVTVVNVILASQGSTY